jgi:TPR repeat protein
LTRNFDDQKLFARAEALLRQGDIVGARILLENMLDKGSARAAFMLAETYDGRMLRTWGTYGIRADNDKARELYARAAAAGIEAAQERLESPSAGASGSSR